MGDGVSICEDGGDCVHIDDTGDCRGVWLYALFTSLKYLGEDFSLFSPVGRISFWRNPTI